MQAAIWSLPGGKDENAPSAPCIAVATGAGATGRTPSADGRWLRPCSTRWASGTRTPSRSSSPTWTAQWCAVLTRAVNIGMNVQHWSDYLDQLRDGARILRPNFGKGRGTPG